MSTLTLLRAKRAARRMARRTARRAAKLAMIAGSLSGTAAFAEDTSVRLEVYPPSDSAHAVQLYRRIQSAAHQVCAPLESRELARLRYYNRCLNDAVSMAVAQVNSSALTAIHLASHPAGVPRL